MLRGDLGGGAPWLHIVGKEELPAEDLERVYRDAHRIVLKSPVPDEGEICAVRIRLHDRPAGDGTAWEVCTYAPSGGEMGEAERFLTEQQRRPIKINPAEQMQEQRIMVSPPIPVEKGQYVGRGAEPRERECPRLYRRNTGWAVLSAGRHRPSRPVHLEVRGGDGCGNWDCHCRRCGAIEAGHDGQTEGAARWLLR
jgi:hypothetical protein